MISMTYTKAFVRSWLKQRIIVLNWLSQLPTPTETSVEPFSFSFLFCLIPRSFVDVVSFRVCNPNNTTDSGRERSGSLCFSFSGGLVMAADFQWTEAEKEQFGFHQMEVSGCLPFIRTRLPHQPVLRSYPSILPN